MLLAMSSISSWKNDLLDEVEGNVVVHAIIRRLVQEREAELDDKCRKFLQIFFKTTL